MAKPQGALYTPQQARWTLHAGKSNEVSIPSLSNFMLPVAIEVTEVTAVEIGRPLDRVFGAGAANVPINFDVNFSKLDPTRTMLRTFAGNHTDLNDSRFYLDACDFAAVDLVNDPAGAHQVGTIGPPSAGKNEIVTHNIVVLPNGQFLFFENHRSGAGLSTTANGGVGTPATIVDSNDGFLTAGFRPGMTVYLDAVDGNDPYCAQIATVVAGLITLAEGVCDEAAIPAFTFTSAAGIIHGADPLLLETTADCNG